MPRFGLQTSAIPIIDYTRPLVKEPPPAAEQWRVPGPHSKHVHAMGSIPVPAYGSTAVISSFTVPTGMRFSLRALTFAANVLSWVPGSGDIVFSLQVVSGGTRFVDGYNNILTQLGSLEIPFPVFGRLEFDSDDVLNAQIQSVANVSVGLPSSVTAIILGHTYPLKEAR